MVAHSHIRHEEVVVEVPDDVVLMAENSSVSELLAEEGLLKPAAEDALFEVGRCVYVYACCWLLCVCLRLCVCVWSCFVYSAHRPHHSPTTFKQLIRCKV